jgi:RHS repeat-associated protein
VYLESDTASIPVREYINWYPVEGGETQSWDGTKYSPSDPNPLHGRVAYTHGLGIDQPLSIVRIGLNRYYTPALNYNNSSPSDTSVKSVAFAPFAAFPQSDWRGHVDGATYAGGAKQHCETFSGTERCTSVVMSQTWSAYGHEDPSAVEWHGTLLTGKRDATGTMYRRARYYDPQTGRFTQEDPIGLAGGVNLYGYAAGDPINLSDPSGLCPWCIGAVAGAIVGAGVYHLSTPAGQRTAWGYLGYAAGGAAIGGTLGYAASALLPAAAPTTGTAVQIGEVTQLTRGIVSLDTNALIAAIEGTPAAQAAVQQALAGRVPALSRTVIREFMRKGNAEALRKYMFENGVVVIADGSPSVVQGLVAQGLKLADAKVVAAAIGRGVGVLTRDARLLRRMIPGVWQF